MAEPDKDMPQANMPSASEITVAAFDSVVEPFSDVDSDEWESELENEQIIQKSVAPDGHNLRAVLLRLFGSRFYLEERGETYGLIYARGWEPIDFDDPKVRAQLKPELSATAPRPVSSYHRSPWRIYPQLDPVTNLPQRLFDWVHPTLPEPLPALGQMNTNSACELIRHRIETYRILMPDNLAEGYGFWPPVLFNHLVSKNDLLQVIREEVFNDRNNGQGGGGPLTGDDEEAMTNHIWGTATIPGARRLFVSLILAGVAETIVDFLGNGVTDYHLPLPAGKVNAGSSSQWHGRNPCREWSSETRRQFLTAQRDLSVPFLQSPPPREGGLPSKPNHYVLGPGVPEPWTIISQPEHLQILRELPSHPMKPTRIPDNWSAYARRLRGPNLPGGPGWVRQAYIHPWQHSLGEIPQGFLSHKNLFLLKQFSFHDSGEFAMMLNNHKGSIWDFPHAIPLLCTVCVQDGIRYRDDGVYYLVFPWADLDLSEYLELNPDPEYCHEAVRWLTEQLHALVSTVVSVPHVNIKPDNILWIRGATGGKFVLTDLGPTSWSQYINRKQCESTTPDCWAPEAQMGVWDHSQDSTSVWQFGCVMLDLIVWILQGQEEKHRWHMSLVCPLGHSSSGWLSKVLWEVVKLQVKGRKDRLAFTVERNVTNKLNELHEHPRCSQYFHDLLDLLQREILIIESNMPRVKRLTMSDLAGHLKRMHVRCRDDADYAVKSCPRPSITPALAPVLGGRVQAMALEYLKINSIGVDDLCQVADRPRSVDGWKRKILHLVKGSRAFRPDEAGSSSVAVGNGLRGSEKDTILKSQIRALTLDKEKYREEESEEDD